MFLEMSLNVNIISHCGTVNIMIFECYNMLRTKYDTKYEA
jgi:hypothetical protein